MVETRENTEPMNRTWARFLPAFLRGKIEGREYLQNVISNTGWQFADQILRMGVGLVIWIWLAAFPAMVAVAPPATEANPSPKPQLTGVASLLQSFSNQ